MTDTTARTLPPAARTETGTARPGGPPADPARAGGAQPSGRRARRSTRTRADYLDAALAMANQRSHLGAVLYAHAVAHVDVAQVAEAVGVSRTAVYRMWDTQESFRADLAAYLAAVDDAPWMRAEPATDDPPPPPGPPPGPGPGPGDPGEALRRRLDAQQASLLNDARPLLRAGISGYPDAGAVTAVIAEREAGRLADYARVVDDDLRRAGRRCVEGIGPADIGMATCCLSEGLALAARMSSPGLPLAVGDRPGGGRSLLAVAVQGLIDRLTEPAGGDEPAVAGAGDEPAVAGPGGSGTAGPRAADMRHSGRRLRYLRVAARLAEAEPGPGVPPGGGALGYVSLDALARSVGVNRGTVRKLWPTQAAFRGDLFVHLLRRDRETIARHLTDDLPPDTLEGRAQAGVPEHPGSAGGGDALLRAGDRLVARAASEGARVGHLSFAPQFIVPAFRSRAQHHVDVAIDRSSTAIAGLQARAGRRPAAGLTERQVTLLALAFVDGMTRMVRTHPGLGDDGHRHHPPGHPLALAFRALLLGLTEPTRDRPGPSGSHLGRAIPQPDAAPAT